MPTSPDGTLNQQSTRIPVALRRESAAGGWMRGLRFSGFSLIMMGLAVLAVVVLAPTAQSWVTQRQQIAALQQAVAAEKSEVDSLTAERERWNDKTFITTQARERLAYVMPGEVSFLVINDLPASAAAEPAPVSTEVQATKSDWMQSLFASTMAAGLAPVAPEGSTK
ncbi:septum formation initiator family protein [Leifsonia sp. YIM 134122]|uniref:Septum formation initiator family protein n=1 Tax=Leifsonia stereocauli TaxID=3134136 RepID=A0ABU9VZY0_9MICO